MSRGINKVILVGNLGHNPETRYTSEGKAVTNATIATSDNWKNKKTGEIQERTEWHRLVMYERLAEIAKEYLKKGSKIYVEGKLRTNKWQDKESGQDRYTTEIIVSDLQILSPKDYKGDDSNKDIQWGPKNTNNLDTSFADDNIPF